MIAAVCAWHEHHEAAAGEIESRFDRGERLAVAAHALIEAYAVLTRLPAPHRLSPGDAWTLIKTNFVERATIVGLGGRGHVALIERLSASGIAGGRSYDALIGTCAEKAAVRALLTFNPRHFDPPSRGVAVIEPS
jgi:predicted nucleic acid-binding protein